MVEQPHLLQLVRDVQSAAESLETGDLHTHNRLHDAVDKLQREVQTPLIFARRQHYRVSPSLDRKRRFDPVTRLREISQPPMIGLLYVLFADSEVDVTTKMVENTCLFMATEMGLLNQLVLNQDRNISALELSTVTGYDQVLIARVMRVVTAMGFANEAGRQLYAANAVTVHQMKPGWSGHMMLTNEAIFSLAAKMRDYLRTYAPCDIAAIPPAYDFANGEDLWTTLRKNKELKKAFDDCMTVLMKEVSIPWFVKYPVAERLLLPKCDRSNHENGSAGGFKAPTIVDIGGNQGVDLQYFADAFPQLHYNLILQDLPETLSNIPTGLISDRVTPMAYDFFTGQPVKGADIYYFKSVLHDWDDASCIKILSNTAKVMSSESDSGFRAHDRRLLLNEIVLADEGETIMRVNMDMLMMLMCNGMERTKTHWGELLAKVEPPLKVVEIWSVTGDTQSVIECCLA